MLPSQPQGREGRSSEPYLWKKNKIILTWKHERSPEEACGSPSTLHPPSPSSTREDPQWPQILLNKALWARLGGLR